MVLAPHPLPEFKPSWWETGIRARAQAGLKGVFTELPGLVVKAVRVAWRADRARTSTVCAATLVAGVMSALGLLATQQVLIRLFEGGPSPDRLRAALPALVWVGVATALRGGLNMAVGYALNGLTPWVMQAVERQLYEHTTSVELVAFDDEGFEEGMERATRGAEAAIELVQNVMNLVALRRRPVETGRTEWPCAPQQRLDQLDDVPGAAARDPATRGLAANQPANPGHSPRAGGPLPRPATRRRQHRAGDHELAGVRQLAARPAGHRTVTRQRDVLGDYASHVAALRRSESTSRHALYAVSLLWGFAPHLPPGDRIPIPPWEAHGVKHYLPTDLDVNENTTPPIRPAVMSPLLLWAMRFVQDFADDIITACEHRELLISSLTETPNPSALARLKTLFEHSAATGAALPGQPYADGRWGLANTYLACLHVTNVIQVKNLAARYRGRLTVGITAPLDTPINGGLHGRLWREAIDFHEAPTLMSLLATAGLIVVCYLSGARPSDVLNLKAGCCTTVTDADSIRYQLHGDFFKGARDSSGAPAPDGTPRRVPWTVIAPVAAAISVLERLAHDDLLFPVHAHWMSTDVERPEWNRHTTALTCQVANTRIARFITPVNSLAGTQERESERIPDDPDGPILMARFRRILSA